MGRINRKSEKTLGPDSRNGGDGYQSRGGKTSREPGESMRARGESIALGLAAGTGAEAGGGRRAE